MDAVMLALLLVAVVLSFGALVIGMAGMQRDLGELRERASELHANLMVARKKRRGLIDQLEAHVRAYVRHERDSFGSGATSFPRVAQSGITFITLAGEKYPHLKADATYLQLMTQLTSIEAELQVSVEAYNGAVRQYNSKAAPAPGFFSWAYGYSPMAYETAFDDDSGTDDLPNPPIVRRESGPSGSAA